MNLNNVLTDIFTEYDESVYSDSSLDPMGLRIIWTGLGNAIFQNKLNTTSTDIRLYTLNLLHHYIIWHAKQVYKDDFALLFGKQPYFNNADLYDGLIIFLESLLTHAAFRINQNRSNEKQISVPGIDKLSSLNPNPNDSRVKYFTVARNAGILTRQYLLGIHGRHKGPFQQIGFFKRNNYYQNATIWNETGKLFCEARWNYFVNTISHIIHTYILKNDTRGKGPIIIEVDKVLNSKIVEMYEELLAESTFKTDLLRKYWEDKLGLLNGPAALLYLELKNTIIKQEKLTIIDYERIIKGASEKGCEEDNQFIKAIYMIEPLIAMFDKIVNRLLMRGTTITDDNLLTFIRHHFQNKCINPDEIKVYLEKGFLNGNAKNRLLKLYEIYMETLRKDDPSNFIHKIISYHKMIMESRNNLPWLSIGNDGQITQHRSFVYQEKYIQKLVSYTWVNDYYLSTVKSLYEGLYGQ